MPGESTDRSIPAVSHQDQGDEVTRLPGPGRMCVCVDMSKEGRRGSA